MNEAQAVNLVCFAEEAGRYLGGADAARWRERLDHRYSECEAARR